MSSIICPTITEKSLPDYNKYLEILEEFATRVHIDFADGEFAPTKLLNVIEAHWPTHIHADFHLMMRDPLKEIETVISQHPGLVILHAESENVSDMIDELNSLRIKTGIALLPDTSVESAGPLIEKTEHILIFAGHLGYQGGEADLSQLEKIAEIRRIKPEIEIGWDGGVNEKNIERLADAGIDVINVGGYIRNATDPKSAHAKLEKLLN